MGGRGIWWDVFITMHELIDFEILQICQLGQLHPPTIVLLHPALQLLLQLCLLPLLTQHRQHQHVGLVALVQSVHQRVHERRVLQDLSYLQQHLLLG